MIITLKKNHGSVLVLLDLAVHSYVIVRLVRHMDSSNEYYQFTDVLLNNIKDRFPTTNFIGIRVLPNRDASRFIRLYNPYGK